MKRTVLLLLLILGLNVYGQSIADLDNEPSFKGITIGNSISQYSDIAKFVQNQDGQAVYMVTDKKYLSVFNVPMDEMYIIVKQNKVKSIRLRAYKTANSSGVYKFEGDDMLRLTGGLIGKYGKPNVTLDRNLNQGMVTGNRWKGKRYSVDIAYVFYSVVEQGKPHIDYVLFETPAEDY